MEINRAKISAVLSGEMQTHELTPAEQTAWLDAFTEKMAHETAAERAFYERRQQLGKGSCSG